MIFHSSNEKLTVQTFNKHNKLRKIPALASPVRLLAVTTPLQGLSYDPLLTLNQPSSCLSPTLYPVLASQTCSGMFSSNYPKIFKFSLDLPPFLSKRFQSRFRFIDILSRRYKIFYAMLPSLSGSVRAFNDMTLSIRAHGCSIISRYWKCLVCVYQYSTIQNNFPDLL